MSKNLVSELALKKVLRSLVYELILSMGEKHAKELVEEIDKIKLTPDQGKE